MFYENWISNIIINIINAIDFNSNFFLLIKFLIKYKKNLNCVCTKSAIVFVLTCI